MTDATKRFLIGGAGGLAPVFAFLIAVDLEKQLNDTNLLQILGYSLRVLALFAIGGFIAWLHENEDKPFKLFEIGLGAPALLAGLITTKSIIPDQQARADTTRLAPVAMSITPLSTAYAQAAPPPAMGTADVKSFRIPKAEGSDAFFQGLLGVAPRNIYYVVVGSHLKFEEAKKQAEQINAKFKRFNAEVYAPYADNPHYAVVIGANLSKGDANDLLAQAIQAGLPKDSYLWTFPSLR
jgi:hypothetical protein